MFKYGILLLALIGAVFGLVRYLEGQGKKVCEGQHAVAQAKTDAVDAKKTVSAAASSTSIGAAVAKQTAATAPAVAQTEKAIHDELAAVPESPPGVAPTPFDLGVVFDRLNGLAAQAGAAAAGVAQDGKPAPADASP